MKYERSQAWKASPIGMVTLRAEKAEAQLAVAKPFFELADHNTELQAQLEAVEAANEILILENTNWAGRFVAVKQLKRWTILGAAELTKNSQHPPFWINAHDVLKIIGEGK
jgi:hypothetical protein